MDPVVPGPAADSVAAETPVPTISATRDAASRGDFAAFDDAHRAARDGKPLARVDAPPAAAQPVKPGETPAPAAPVLSRKEREQNEANERTRKAVELATEDLRKQIEELRGAPRVAKPAAVEKPVIEKETPVQMAKRYAALPDAPKLVDFDTVEEHAAAMALFIDQTRTEERTTAARRQSDTDQRTTEQTQRISAFDTRVTELAKADPDIVSKIVPVAKSLGTGTGPNKVISDVVMDSPVGPQLLRHFAEHPDALARLLAPIAGAKDLTPQTAINKHIQFILRELSKLEESFATPDPPADAEPAPAPRTISAAPPPPPILTKPGSTSDPKAAALKRGDFATFNALELAEKVEKRRAATA